MALILDVCGIDKRLQQPLHIVKRADPVKLDIIRHAKVLDLMKELLRPSITFIVACLLGTMILLRDTAVLVL